MKNRIVSLVLALLLMMGMTACFSTDGYDDVSYNDDPVSEIEPLEIPDIVLYQKGDKGSGVQAVQQLLIDAGFLDDAADGSFGPRTKEAVEALQESLGVEVTGELTSHALLSLCDRYVSGNANLDELQKTDDDGYVPATYDAYDNGELAGKNIYVRGRILFVVNYDDLVIETEQGELWCLSISTTYDLTEFAGTECEVFGQMKENAPETSEFPTLCLVEDEASGLWLVDGQNIIRKPASETKPEPETTPESTPEPTPTPMPIPEPDPTPEPTKSETMVWIPTNGGTKYHSKSSCSNMKNPEHVTKSEAIARGFTQCGRCW